MGRGLNSCPTVDSSEPESLRFPPGVSRVRRERIGTQVLSTPLRVSKIDVKSTVLYKSLPTQESNPDPRFLDESLPER